MGIEFLGPGNPPIDGEIRTTGHTLRDVLNAMVSVDPRYEWRELDGVIVIRPAVAWNDPQSLLFRLAAPVRMIDVTPQEVIEHLARELGQDDVRIGGMPAGKPLSIDLPQGTLLDLANAILRAHGELTWALEQESPSSHNPENYRYKFTVTVMNGVGLGLGAR